MKPEITNKQLRSFGLLVGGIFAGIALWPAIFHGAQIRTWAGALAAILLLPALVYSRSLYWVHKGWMALGHIMGSINTRIILGLVFFVIVTPIGFVRRLLGKDPMGTKLKPAAESYRVSKKARPPSHLTRQF
jgi:hypothetical protein